MKITTFVVVEEWVGKPMKNNSTLRRLILATIGWWVTFDPAESPLLPERNMLCPDAIEYNQNVSKGKNLLIPALSSKTSRYYIHICIDVKI